VTVCLAALCLPPGHSRFPSEETILTHYQQMDHVPQLAVFNTRLGLTVIDALGGARHPRARALLEDLVNHVVRSSNGYAARELLGHLDSRGLLTSVERYALKQVVAASGLDAGTIGADLLSVLTNALMRAEAVICGRTAG
jgi:hypothetical protein